MTHRNQIRKRNGLVLASHDCEAIRAGASCNGSSLMTTVVRSLLVLAMLVLGGLSCAVAQTAANLDGFVQDPTGALIPKAKVTLTNSINGQVRNTLSNGAGAFSFSSLETGDYVLRVDAEGFQSVERNGIHLNPGDQRTLRDLKLAVAGVAEVSVTVVSEEGQVSTDSGESSTLISSADIEHLAIEGRDVTELLKILPGMSINPSSSTDLSNRAYDPSMVAFTGAIGNYAANGTQTNSTALLSDNMDITDPGSYGIAIQNVNYDQVAEVKVQTGSFTADTAHGPVVINAVGRAGGKDYHGSLYTYARTNQLNSLDWIAKFSGQPAPHDRQVYPGFTIGGPVRIPKLGFTQSKKLTFFLGAEEYAQRNVYAYNSASAAQVSALVPTAAMRTGDFSPTQLALYLGPNYLPNASGNCTNVYVNLCTSPAHGPDSNSSTIQLGGNLSSYIDPLGKMILNAMPLPNVTSNGQYNFITTDFVNSNLLQIRGRLDFALSDKTQMFLSYGIETGKQYQPASPYGRQSPNGMGGQMDQPGGGFVDTVTSHVASFRVTSVLSPSLTNEFYAGGAYFTQPFDLKNSSASLGNPYQGVFNNGSKAIPSWITWGAAQYGGLPFMSIEDSTWGATFTKKQMRLAGDNMTKLIQRHTLRAGIYYQWVDNPQMQQGQNTNGQISDYYHPTSFSDPDGTTVYGTGNYLADILVGTLGGYTQTNKKIETNLYFYQLSGYVQDHWLVSRHLSIDAGIRFEHSAPWSDPHGLGVAVFDPQAYASGSPVASPGVLYHAIDSAIPLSGVPARSVFYEPRGGFVYDFHGNSKTIIRGGYGQYRQHDSYNDGLSSAQTAQGQRTYATAASGHTFAKLYLLQNAVTNSNGFTVDSTINTRMKGDDTIPGVQTYNLMLDQRLPHNTGFEIGYVGNRADHLMESSSLRNINALPKGSLFKPLPDTGRQDLTGYVGQTASYFASGILPALPYLTTAEIDAYRPYPLYQNINAIKHRGYSNYNGLQTMFFWQPSHGRISANYTWSKTLGAIAGPDPINIDNDYLPLSMDRRHILNFSYSYWFGSVTKERVLGWFANGWEISGYTGMQGGPILNTVMPQNFNLTATLTVPVGTTATLPNAKAVTCGAGIANPSPCAMLINSASIMGSPDYTLMPTEVSNPRGKTTHQYVDGSAFRLPAFGNNGPNYLGPIRGPLFFNSDLTLSKTFKTYKKNTLQMRVAAFNFLNRANYTFSSLYPGAYGLNFTQTESYTDMNQALTNATNQQSGFGTTKMRAGRRILEVSAKYQF